MYGFGQYKKPVGPVHFCYAWQFFVKILPVTFHTASIWLTLVLTIQRFPFKHLKSAFTNVLFVADISVCARHHFKSLSYRVFMRKL